MRVYNITYTNVTTNKCDIEKRIMSVVSARINTYVCAMRIFIK